MSFVIDGDAAGIELTNPVIAASGTFGYGIEFEEIVSLERIGAFVTKGQLYAAYQQWTFADGGKPVSAREFHERAEAAGYVTTNWSGTEGYRGLSVTSSASLYQP